MESESKEALCAELQARQRGARVANDLKRRVAAYAEAEQRTGRMYKDLADELGVTRQQLREWRLARAAIPSQFRRVTVQSKNVQSRSIAVDGPNGLRFELDADTLVDLLRRLA